MINGNKKIVKTGSLVKSYSCGVALQVVRGLHIVPLVVSK